jgi:hypothetical protein
MSLDCTGTIQTDVNGYPLCVGGEWINNGFYQLLESVFATPTQAEIQAAFMAGFLLPMIAYLTAWAFGTVIDFATKDRS